MKKVKYLSRAFSESYYYSIYLSLGLVRILTSIAYKQVTSLIWCGVKIKRSVLLNYLFVFTSNFFPLYFLLIYSIRYLYTIKYFPVNVLMESISIFHIYVALFIILGSILLYYIQHRSILTTTWILFSSVFFVLSLFALVRDLFDIDLLSASWGAIAGIGIPNILISFKNMTAPEERGRIAGFLSFVSYVVGMIIALALRIQNSLIALLILFNILRVSSVISLNKVSEYFDTVGDKPDFNKLFLRSFLLLLISWMIFCMVNQFLIITVTFTSGYETAIIIGVITMVLGSFAMPVVGILADLFGRSRLLIASFSLIGIAAGLLALSPYSAEFIMLYALLYGVAWGALTVLLVLVVWGDLAGDFDPVIFYAFGVAAYFASAFIARQVGFSLSAILDLGQIYLASAAILFLMLPAIISIPESLPNEARDKIWLEWYAKQAREISKQRALKR